MGPAKTSCFCLFYLDHQGSSISCKPLCWGQSWNGGHEILSLDPYVIELSGLPAVNKTLVGALLHRAGVKPTGTEGKGHPEDPSKLPSLPVVSKCVGLHISLSKEYFEHAPQHMFL